MRLLRKWSTASARARRSLLIAGFGTNLCGDLARQFYSSRLYN